MLCYVMFYKSIQASYNVTDNTIRNCWRRSSVVTMSVPGRRTFPALGPIYS